MNPTDTTIPTHWITHGFCPRGAMASLRLQKHDGSIVLQLTRADLCLAFICVLLAIGSFVFWWLFPWGTETSDIEMKWITVGAGFAFSIIAFWSSLTSYRFVNYGQLFTLDTDNDVVILRVRNNVEKFPLQDIKGLQILSRPGDAQLILLCETEDHVERRWIHTDFAWQIELLAEAFERDCNLPVVSRKDTRPRKTTGDTDEI